MHFVSMYVVINLGEPRDDYNPVYRDHFSKKQDELVNEHSKNPVHENVIEKLVELLIKNGADINQPSMVGTPLDSAQKRCTVQLINTI